MNPTSGDTAASPVSENGKHDSALLQELLINTSRTFGLAIPLLPDPLQHQITIAYLLFRVADTIEDANFANGEEKSSTLQAFSQLIRQPADQHQAMATSINAGLNSTQIQNQDYLQLMRHLPELMRATNDLPRDVRAIILSSLEQSVQGMDDFVAKGDARGNVQLTSLEQVRGYCYSVAGIVGEMLTELFIHADDRLLPEAEGLRQRACEFGEGLQLVNILKDSDEDAAAGRNFVPSDLPRSQLFELARSDLHRAQEYNAILTESKTSASLIAFCELPLQLAWHTLDCVEATGPGSKVPREEVAALVTSVLGKSPQNAKGDENACKPKNDATRS